MIKYVFTSIIEMPAWLNEEHAIVIGNNAVTFYQRCDDQSSKVDTIKVMLISAKSVANQQERSKITEFILTQAHKLPVVDVSAISDFMAEYESQTFFADFQKRFIQSIWNNSIKNRINNSDQRVQELFLWCVKVNKFIEPDELRSAVKVMFSAEGTLQSWRVTLIHYSSKISKDTVFAMAEDLVAIIDHSNNEGYAKSCFELLIVLLENVTQEKGNQMTARLIGWLTHKNVMVRKLAILYLDSVKNISAPNVFKATLNNITSSLCNVNLGEVKAHEESLRAVLKYKELWSEDEWEDLSKLIKRLLDLNNDIQMHSYGRILLREMPAIPKKSVGDVTASLIALATSTSNAIDKSETEELIALMKKNLDKKMVKAYLAKKNQ